MLSNPASLKLKHRTPTRNAIKHDRIIDGHILRCNDLFVPVSHYPLPSFNPTHLDDFLGHDATRERSNDM